MAKPVKGWPRYEINADGTIRNVLTGHELKHNISSNGYHSVELFDDSGKHKRISVHRLVATAFVPNPNNYPCVNHKDEIKGNNNAENLEWCSYKYNSNYGNAKERARKALAPYRESEQMKESGRRLGRSRCKPVLQYTKDGQFVSRHNSVMEAQRATGANNSHITECCAGKGRKTVNGYVWRYEKEE